MITYNDNNKVMHKCICPACGNEHEVDDEEAQEDYQESFKDEDFSPLRHDMDEYRSQLTEDFRRNEGFL